MKIQDKITITIALTLFIFIFITAFAFTQLFLVNNRNNKLIDLAQQNIKLTTFTENNFPDIEEAIDFYKKGDYLTRIENIYDTKIIITDPDFKILISPLNIENRDLKEILLTSKEIRRFFTFNDILLLIRESDFGKLFYTQIGDKNYYVSIQEMNIGQDSLFSIFFKQNTELTIPPLRYLLNILLIILIAALISIIMGLILGRNISRPISKLNRSVDRISNGDYSENIKASGYKEISILAKNINIMKNKIQKSQDSLKSFTYMISHEVKNMLTSINGYAVGISEGVYSTDKDIKEALNIIKNKTRDLENITDSLLMLSKIENKIIDLSREEIEIKNIIDEILESYETVLDKNNIRIKRIYDIEKEPRPKSDKYLIQTVISNLINNAIKYATSDSEVMIQVNSDKKNLIFSVANKGPGISDEEKDKIFNMFYRSKTRDFKHIKGFGLGLAISKKISNILNADLDFKSDNDINTFIFKIPIE
jgi:signal transduction histidine kinase